MWGKQARKGYFRGSHGGYDWVSWIPAVIFVVEYFPNHVGNLRDSDFAKFSF